MTGRAAAATLLGAAAVFVHTCRRLLLQVTITTRRHRRRHLWCVVYSRRRRWYLLHGRGIRISSAQPTGRSNQCIRVCTCVPLSRTLIFIFYNISEVLVQRRNTIFFSHGTTMRRIINKILILYPPFSIFVHTKYLLWFFLVHYPYMILAVLFFSVTRYTV